MMKFRFANVGPIAKAEMELGDLTIIAGRNNTGKTYLVYTLYGFLRTWRTWPDALDYMQRQSRKILQENSSAQVIDVKKISKKLDEEGQYKCLMNRAALNRDRKKMISRIARDFSEIKIASIFSSSHSNFAKASIEVDLGSSISNKFTGKLEYSGEVISIKYDKENLIFSAEKFTEKSFPISRIEYLVSSIYMQFLLMSLPRPFIISAERFGISLFYKELDFTKNRLVETLQNMGDDKNKDDFSPYILIEKYASRYALPIKDNIDYTRDIARSVKEKSKMHHAKLYDDVKKIMEGYYKSDEKEIRFVSKRRKGNHFDIPLHLASSSARGLSDLYFYLRHVAMKNELLIIDEPESHLDTRNQIMLARMLAHFVRNGIKVLITTHSDYVLKEINNLIMLSNSFEGKGKLIKKFKYHEDEFLHPESLRCYIAENRQLTRCEVDKFGADIPIFDKTIDDINRVSNELAAWLEHKEEK